MDVKSLESFSAVYECGSMSKAAERLYISPQGLSKQVARLESELGVTLFERTTQGVRPTPFADELYVQAARVVDIFQTIRASAERAGRRSTLRVPAVSGMLSYLGLDFIAEFERTHPGVRLRLEDLGDASVDRLMTSGKADIAFMSCPINPEKFDSIPFISEPHVLVVGKDDRLAGRESVSMRDLDGRLVMLLGQDYSTNEDMVARMRAVQATPGEVMGVVETDTAMMFVSQGQAVFIGAAWWAHRYRWADVVVIPFDEPNFNFDVHIVKRRGFPLGTLEREFERYALDWLAAAGRV